MKKLLLALAISIALPASAHAATATLPNGSISIVYVNAEGTVTYSPYATISDATAGAFVTWCEAHYAATVGANTALGCFNTWADDWINQTIASMLSAGQITASAAAAAAVTPPAIVNHQ